MKNNHNNTKALTANKKNLPNNFYFKSILAVFRRTCSQGLRARQTALGEADVSRPSVLMNRFGEKTAG